MGPRTLVLTLCVYLSRICGLACVSAMGGGGNSFSGQFGVSVLGGLDVVYISSSGKQFESVKQFEFFGTNLVLVPT